MFVLIFEFVKKLIPLVLFISLLLPFVVTYSVIHFEKKQVKRSVKHKIIDGIDKSELVLLQFSKLETEQKLSWKHSKEFEYLGEMYDIVETIESGDSVVYYCWWDNEETLLNKKLAQALSGILPLNSKNTKTQNLLAQFAKTLFCADNHQSSLVVPVVLKSTKATFLEEKVKLLFSEVPTPPPLFV